MKDVRKILFKVHGYLALLALIPIILIALTGSLLVFKFELDSLLLSDRAIISEAGQNRMPMNQLVAGVNRSNPDYEIGSWELFDDGYEADRVYLIKTGTEQWYKLFLNPYTGKMLSKPEIINHYFTDWLLEVHYTLLLNDLWHEQPQLGTLIGLIVAIMLTFLGVSGLIIYRKFWRKILTFKPGKNRQTQYREIHRQVGIWSSPIFLIIGMTGIYFNLVEFLHEQEEHADGAGHYIMETRLYNDQVNFDEMLLESQRKLSGFKPTYFLFPYEPELHFTIFGEVPTMNIFASEYGSTVSFDKQTAAFISAYDIREQSFVNKLVDSLRELHFGNFAGLYSKVPYAIVGVGILVSCISGLLMWLRRKRILQ